ncbi:MAG: CBS domain-containing protein [Pseudomonadota bacterium]
MPASFRPPLKADKEKKKRTTSQSKASNMMQDTGTVADLLAGKTGPVIAISPEDTLSKAVAILRDKRIGALVVTDEAGKVAGILSERDIVRKLAETPGQTLPQSVTDNMTAPVVTCEASDSLVDVLRRMTEGRFRHMPVVEGEKPVGMVTIGDVVQYRLSELEQETLQLKQMIVG